MVAGRGASLYSGVPKELLGGMVRGRPREHPGPVSSSRRGDPGGGGSGPQSLLVGSLEGGPDDPFGFWGGHFPPLAVGPNELEEAAPVLVDAPQDGLDDVAAFRLGSGGPVHFDVEVDQALEVVVPRVRTRGFFRLEQDVAGMEGSQGRTRGLGGGDAAHRSG